MNPDPNQLGNYGRDIYMQYEPTNNNPLDVNVPIPNHNELTTNGVCKKFIHGKCRLSDNCPYPHDKSKIKPCNKF